MVSAKRNPRIPSAGRVLLAEDDDLFAENLRSKLERVDVQCDWATTRDEAMEALKTRTYHALLVDIFLDSVKPLGLEIVRLGKEAGIPSVILTSRLNMEIAKVGLNNGADYLLEKPFEFQALLKILNDIWENPRGLVARRERFLETHQLTEKEKDLTRLLLKGLSNKEIANVSGLTLNTVKFYTNLIFEKCEVSGRSELFNFVFPT